MQEYSPTHSALAKHYLEKSAEIKKHFNRVVSFGDTVVDRWQKAEMLGFGTGTSIYDSALVLGDVRVGEHVWIGPGVVLDGSQAPLRVGSYCSISAGVQIYTHDSVAWAVTGGKHAHKHGAVSIGSCVYLGPNSIISANISIGNHVIIGAQSLVKTSFHDYSVAWGQPATRKGRLVLHADHTDYSIVYD